MKFFQFQKSAWVYPFPCEKEIFFVAKVFNISNDYFIRTTSHKHFSGAQKLWLATKVKDIFVKKGQAAAIVVPITEEKPVEPKEAREERPEPAKVKNAPKAEAPVKVKKVKKGPKKIVRKERQFVR